MVVLKLLITRTIRDKNGNIVKQVKSEAKSFVKAFMQCLEVVIAHNSGNPSDGATVKDTSNADQGINVSTEDADENFACESPANDDSYGVQIGIGTTAPVVTDYTIETQILHGVSTASKMEHGATSVQAAGVSGSNMEMTITRAFVNSSGGTIVVKEVGLVNTWTTADWKFLLIHDAVNDSVADGQTYTITYTFTTTV